VLKCQNYGTPVTRTMTSRVTTDTDLSHVSNGFQRRDSCTFPYCHIVRQFSEFSGFCVHIKLFLPSNTS